ncbi:MAG: hypothetical protein Q9219_004613 [cf. Caloplaca sp. 3 TL-2023]
MPGRKSTQPFSHVSKPIKPRNSKRKKERSLNALAIAEKTHPERSHVRRHRLGESESGGNDKRKREVAQPDYFDDTAKKDNPEHSTRSKRRKLRDDGEHENEMDYGSDSEGNEWTLGDVASDMDDSLDSDEALGESDEERFDGFVFGGSSSKGTRREKTQVQEDEEEFKGFDLDERADVEDDDDFGDEGIDLATALDDGTEDETATESVDGFGSAESAREIAGESSADEDLPESVLDDEDDSQDQAKLASLQSLVKAMNEQDQGQAISRRIPDINESSAPSEYGLKSKQKLTVADLLPSVKDPQLKKSLRILADSGIKASSKRNGIAKKLDVPLPKRQQDRLDRAVAYEKSKETLNRWIDTVKHNRRSEHLSFPLHDPDVINAQGDNKIGRHAKPLTDLETTIQSILLDSGFAPVNGKSEEEQIQAFEELETNKMPLEEVQFRRAELRKARDLLFREEIKARRINKIKSKSYRRVHRKERERQAQGDKEALVAAGVEDSESEKERNDRRRAEERMGAKHRESRWAKQVKGNGRLAWDEDARAGVEEMARREEDLKRRMMGIDEDDSAGESASGDEEEDEYDASGEKASRMLQNRLQRLEDDGDSSRVGVRKSTSALSSMKFMQNAEAARKASNDEAVRQMQRELAGEETESEEEPADGPGRRLYGPKRNSKQIVKPQVSELRSEFEERASSGDESDAPAQNEDEEVQIVLDGPESAEATAKKQARIGNGRGSGSKLSAIQPTGMADENPWLSGGKRKFDAHNRRTQDAHAPATISNELPDTYSNAAPPTKSMDIPPSNVAKVKVKGQTSRGPATPAQPSNDDGSDQDSEDTEEKRETPLVLGNQELVRQAFAGDDVVANFAQEKEETMQSEDEKMIDNTLAGWGSWVGAGIGKKAQRRNNNRFLSRQEGIPKAKRQDAKLDKVIINEKRMKKNAKYLASQLPHPFETRQQYERSLRLPVGPEWTTKETFQAATKPRVLIKQGIISPIAKPII